MKNNKIKRESSSSNNNNEDMEATSSCDNYKTNNNNNFKDINISAVNDKTDRLSLKCLVYEIEPNNTGWELFANLLPLAIDGLELHRDDYDISAKGFLQLTNWNMLPLDWIAADPSSTISDIIGRMRNDVIIIIMLSSQARCFSLKFTSEA
ncbi:hypothetical protein HELRODRAFT_168580 [Helobdella robusta]|uniref:Uncharacterized protein n=1 Tax=Helobdella robusta TaxID=6412 RepID=T1F0R5_HELRO|nr:hypothetical protein HELRODRAFT_168580 [Helobdella robusta]ESO09575.1 hypothetical protein HELRODRAFT_168580 [Helobdella robusta]